MENSLHAIDSSGMVSRSICASCGSANETRFNAEVAVHFPGLKNIDKPTVLMFPALLICLDCGMARFAVPEAELGVLATGEAAAATA
jgi:hypothetical protein